MSRTFYAGEITADWLTTAEEIAAEREPWEAIVDRHHDSNPFLSIDWSLAWLRHFAAPSTTLCFIKIRRGSEIAGYFPLLSGPEKFHGLTIQALRFAGNLYSPVNTPILNPAHRPAAMAMIVRHVLPALSFSVFLADDLPEEDPATAELQCRLQQGGYQAIRLPSVGNWIWEGSSADSAAYFSALKHNIRNDTRRFPKKLAAMGTLQFRLAKSDLCRQDIDAYLAVYARSWKEPEVEPRFHPHLMEVAVRRGWLRLGLLLLDDRPIAAQLWLFSRHRGYVVKTAYDEAFRQFSPGTVLTWRVIERLMNDEHMVSFDYLKGDDEYKKYWTNKRRRRDTVVAFQRSLPGAVLHLLDQKVLPWMRADTRLSRVRSVVAQRFLRNGGADS